MSRPAPPGLAALAQLAAALFGGHKRRHAPPRYTHAPSLLSFLPWSFVFRFTTLLAVVPGGVRNSLPIASGSHYDHSDIPIYGEEFGNLSSTCAVKLLGHCWLPPPQQAPHFASDVVIFPHAFPHATSLLARESRTTLRQSIALIYSLYMRSSRRHRPRRVSIPSSQIVKFPVHRVLSFDPPSRADRPTQHEKD